MYESFIFYSSFHEACKDLDIAQYGKILYVLNEYALNGVIPETFEDPIVKMAFTFMKPQIDANNARKEAGSKGGRPQNKKPVVIENTENTKPMVIEDNENQKPVVIENDTFSKPNVNVNVNANVNVKEIAAEAAEPSAPSKPKEKKPPLREREPENDIEKIEKAYITKWDSLYNAGVLKTPEPPQGMWLESRAHIRQYLNNGVTVDQIIHVVNSADTDDWVMRGGYLLKTILSSGVFNRILNGQTLPGKQLLKNDLEAMQNMDDFMAANNAKLNEVLNQFDSVGALSNDDQIW